jgi:hypothetical protein
MKFLTAFLNLLIWAPEVFRSPFASFKKNLQKKVRVDRTRLSFRGQEKASLMLLVLTTDGSLVFLPNKFLVQRIIYM